ncbi:MAG: glucosidase [Bacteroidota bacterium]
MSKSKTAEDQRLEENYTGKKDWLKWGPYLSERQWGTVREDYSPYGAAWDYFPHDHARSRVYRWGEDGIAGITDSHNAISFAVALWNGKDPILKERIFGLTGPEGNHGEDCKELYYYLDSTPTHSYMKHLYKYPQNEYPYGDLAHTNANRGKQELEYEVLDTGAFNDNKYFDVFTEYAKADEEDILVKITVYNRAKEAAEITVLPTLWLRNLWSFGQAKGEYLIKRKKSTTKYGVVELTHQKLGKYNLYFQKPDQWMFTNNETNKERLYGVENETPYVKDLFHEAVIGKNYQLTKSVNEGTKFAPMYQEKIGPGKKVEFRLRFSKQDHGGNPLNADFDAIFKMRLDEADGFYKQFHRGPCKDTANIQRQAFAGMLWSKQYFNLDMETWLNGDPGQPKPPEVRKNGRNSSWKTLNNEDIISMPDKWEYPWYAAWDLAFHCIPLAMVDAEFAKNQLVLILREWYMAPNGQIPAYEWAFSDVNPPVQAWAAYKVYEIDKEKTGKGDIAFLKRIFNKLSLNFTWWVNRKDRSENNVFEGGFLGLDNIGVFDRSSQIPGGGYLEQADGTAWMAMYCLNMLQISTEIAMVDDSFEDMCTKYFEHFVHIAASLNRIGDDWLGSWDEHDGFFYDILVLPNSSYIPIKVRSLVGLMTLNAVLVLTKDKLKKLKNFHQGIKWFRDHRQKHGKYLVIEELKDNEDILLSLVPKKRMEKLLDALLDEKEFLSPYGIRALSKAHENPYSIMIEGQLFDVKYDPAESSTHLFGGNSNWRGPIWMPMNFLFVQSLLEYHKYYGDRFKVQCPAGSKNELDLKQLSDDINKRLVNMFKKDGEGNRPVHRLHKDWYRDENFNDLILFYEYFHGDNGRGVGATHQTGWTGCVAHLIDESCW